MICFFPLSFFAIAKSSHGGWAESDLAVPWLFRESLVAGGGKSLETSLRAFTSLFPCWGICTTQLMVRIPLLQQVDGTEARALKAERIFGELFGVQSIMETLPSQKNASRKGPRSLKKWVMDDLQKPKSSMEGQRSALPVPSPPWKVSKVATPPFCLTNYPTFPVAKT